MAEDKRENIRILDQLRFTYERIPSEDFIDFKNRIKEGSTPFVSYINHLTNFSGNEVILDKIRRTSPEVGDMLEQIDAKLNIILGLLNPMDNQKNLFKLHPVYCDLSASGFGFASDDTSIKVGDIFKIDLLLTTPHIVQISFCIEILRLDRKEILGEQKRWIATKICLISDQVKELIIRHVFDLQKEWLRLRNQQKELAS